MSPPSLRAYGAASVVGDAVARPGAVLRLEGWTGTVLPPVRSGSACDAPVSGSGFYLPHLGTSPTIIDRRMTIVDLRSSVETPAQQTSPYEDVVTQPVVDQALEVMAALSLNKSQLADVLGVSRPTLYEWLDGKEPSSSNAGRLTSVQLILRRAGVTSSTPLDARFVKQPVRDGEPSLLDALSAEHLNEGQLDSLARQARGLGDKAALRRRTREARLRALGYDEPSDERRKEQLARNVALRDWPKP